MEPMESDLKQRLLDCLECGHGNAEKLHMALKFIIDRGLLTEFVEHMERSLDPGYYDHPVFEEWAEEDIRHLTAHVEEQEIMSALREEQRANGIVDITENDGELLVDDDFLQKLRNM